MSPTKRPVLSGSKAIKASKTTYTPTKIFPGRDGLGAYVSAPEIFPTSRVLYYTDSFVTIYDLYPKSSIHLLVLPRHHPLSTTHPIDAFNQDIELLESCKQEASKVKRMVASEMCRRFGRYSKKEQVRREAMDQVEEAKAKTTAANLDELPPGRDWESEVLTGVHSSPSMNHLHVHVLSRDRQSECMKHRKHYQSFATPFLIGLNEFPLTSDDVRRGPSRGGYLGNDMKCWRCGKNFGNKFAELKVI